MKFQLHRVLRSARPGRVLSLRAARPSVDRAATGLQPLLSSWARDHVTTATLLLAPVFGDITVIALA